jgi:hypothetical protein
MTPRQLELALKKQRLQFRSAEQRRQLAASAAALTPVFLVAEYFRTGVRWVRSHPAITVGTLVALFVAKPRLVFRWGRRAWLVWLAWRKWGGQDEISQYPSLQYPSLNSRLKNYLNKQVLSLFSK